MSDTPSHGPVKSNMPKWVRGPQDFVGGVALIAIALFALWASSDLQGQHNLALANCFAQAQAFALGQTEAQVRADLGARGVSE